jgi:hypothetical protein
METQMMNNPTIFSGTFSSGSFYAIDILAGQDGSPDSAPLHIQSGMLLTSPESGAIEYDGKCFYLTTFTGSRGVYPTIFSRVISSDEVGQDMGATLPGGNQPWFPTFSGIRLKANTCYTFEGAFTSRRTAGTNNHTTDLTFSGNNLSTSTIGCWVQVKELDTESINDSDLTYIDRFSGRNIKATTNSATEDLTFQCWGYVWISGDTSFVPCFRYSAAPGGAPSIKLGTYFQIYPVGNGAFRKVGDWV